MTHYAFFKLWFSIGLVLVSTIIYLSLTSNPPPMPSIEFGDKFSHLLAYATLTGWFGQLYTRFSIQIWIFIAFCLMGVSLEFIQGMGDARVFEYADMVANTLGAAAGWWLTRTWFAGSLLRLEQILLKK